MNQKERQTEVLKKRRCCSKIRKESFCHCSWHRDQAGMEIGPLIITVIDWLYLAVKDPHHPPTRTITEEANCSRSSRG